MSSLLDLIAQKPAAAYAGSATSPLVATVADLTHGLAPWQVHLAWALGIVATLVTIYAQLRRKRS